jgi:succinyl-CoA synthetase beta subunit
MLLHESEGKELLRSKGIASPRGVVLASPDELPTATQVGFPLAAKAQVAAGGRGKAGGVIRCESAAELAHAFEQIMRLEIEGERPVGVLVEPWLVIERELYLSLTVDGHAGGYSVVYSPTGGIDVESADIVVTYPFGAPEDFRGAALRARIAEAEPDPVVRERVVDLARRMLHVLEAHDCTTVEINPVAQCGDELIPVDAKIVLDDAAAARQSTTASALARAQATETEMESACRRANLVFVPMGGSIGLISGGAGMTMCAMDVVAEAGGLAAGFLDISGNPTARGIEVAIRSLVSLPDTEAILISIFGGGLDVGRIARRTLTLLRDLDVTLPVSFRLAGRGKETADSLLADYGLVNHATVEDAVHALTQAATSR